MRKNAILICCLASVLLLPCTRQSVTAADHINLEKGLPLQVEDAYPIAYRGREIQTTFRYDYTRAEKHHFVIAPQLELGPLPNTEVSIRSPFYLGNASRTGSGDIEIEGLYNFNTEGIYLPALALEATGIIPTGKANDGFDTEVAFIATKSISQMGTDRIHLNLSWAHNAAHRTNEREHRYSAILGYSRRIAADWLILADFVRELEREKNEDSNIFEVGFRWQVTPLTVISVGAGAGIGRESPKARGIVGFQKSF